MAADDYVTEPADLQAGTRARAADVEEKLDALLAGFGVLPAPRNDGKKGFSEPITLEAPTEPGHAATKQWVEALPNAPVAEAQGYRDEALAAKTAAEAAQTAAETAQTGAQTAETNAGTSETNAAGSAAAASTSAGNAATSASNASTSAGNAATSASNASTSAGNAATSETNAASSASAASTSAGNAATSETNAASSASSASSSVTTASNHATSASNSASAAATSETNAAASAQAAQDAVDSIGASDAIRVDFLAEAQGETGGGMHFATKDGLIWVNGFDNANIRTPLGAFEGAHTNGFMAAAIVRASVGEAISSTVRFSKIVRSNNGGAALSTTGDVYTYGGGIGGHGHGNNVIRQFQYILSGRGNIAASGAILNNGAMWFMSTTSGFQASGDNRDGRLGTGSLNAHEYGLDIGTIPGGGLVSDVKTSARHTLFLAGDGKVWASGFNADGGLGDGTTTDQNVLVRAGTMTDITKIAVGGDNDGHCRSFALGADGNLYGWGRGVHYVFNSSENTVESSPIVIAASVDDFKFAGGGDTPALYYLIGTTLYHRGRNGSYESAQGDTTKRSTATVVDSSCSGFWTPPPLWGWPAVIWKRGSKFYAAGRNDYGSLGIGKNQTNADSPGGDPVHLPPGFVPVEFRWGCRYSGSVPLTTVFAIDVDGRMCAAGYNGAGEMGVGGAGRSQHCVFTPCQING